MTAIDLRSLTAADADQIEAVLRSRTKMFDQRAFDVDMLRDLYVGAPHALGLFENGVLDCFITWAEFDAPSPRADDESKVDQRFAKIFGNFSMKKPGRAKLPTGHDKNGGELQAAILHTLRARNVFTYWFQFPAAWQGWVENPTVAAALVDWEIWVSDPIAPGMRPTGSRADFMRAHIMSRNTTSEAMVLRAGSVREECR